jgi:hypothetical protein
MNSSKKDDADSADINDDKELSLAKSLLKLGNLMGKYNLIGSTGLINFKINPLFKQAH